MNSCCPNQPVKIISFDCGVQSSEWSVCKNHENDPLFRKYVAKIREVKNQ